MKNHFLAIIAAMLATTFVSVSSLAQTTDSSDSHLSAHQIFDGGIINPVSPDMWTMLRYGDSFPGPDHQGNLVLSIPIYSYSDETFSIPVNLFYSSSGGYRPNTQCGPEGLGWALSCSASICREVRGIADEEGWIITDMYGVRNKFYGTDDSNLQAPTVYGWASVYDTTGVSSSFMSGVRHRVPDDYFQNFAFTGKAGADYMRILSHTSDETSPSFETAPDIFCLLYTSPSPRDRG